MTQNSRAELAEPDVLLAVEADLRGAGGPAANSVWRKGRKPTTAGERSHAIIEL